MADQQIRDKTGQLIQEGDHVYTRIRGGRHEGDVRGATSYSIYTFSLFLSLSSHLPSLLSEQLLLAL